MVFTCETVHLTKVLIMVLDVCLVVIVAVANEVVVIVVVHVTARFQISNIQKVLAMIEANSGPRISFLAHILSILCRNKDLLQKSIPLAILKSENA